MTRLSNVAITFTAVILLAAACAPNPTRSTGSTPAEVSARDFQNRVLSFPVSKEVTSLAPNMNDAGGTDATLVMFNAGLTVIDELGTARPMLVEALPELNTDTWRLLPDGKMETTYVLRPGLTWHDGQPLDAEDFVFAKRVSANPNVGAKRSPKERLMESVVAADPRTLVIRWGSAHPGANSLTMNELPFLPRHILEQPYANVEQGLMEADAFRNLPYWKSDYIGVGPYRLVQWEPGSHFEGVAFDGFVLGRARIERVISKVMEDGPAFTQILAGTMDLGEVNFEHYQLLQRIWVPEGKGSLLLTIGNPQPNWIQLKPEYVGHPALLDVRVRRALAHSLDRPAINDGAFDGQGIMTETIVPPGASFFPEVDRSIMKYPYDPRRSEQLMNEAGFTKDREGLFVDVASERFVLDFERNNASDRERIQLIMMDTWKRAGFEVKASEVPVAATPEHRATFRGLQGTGSATEASWYSGNLSTAQNRWTGTNNGGFSNAEYDRLYDAFNSTLDQAERTRNFVQMQRVFTEYLPMFLTHFSLNTWAVAAGVRGPKSETKNIGTLTSATVRYFNIHEWEWQ